MLIISSAEISTTPAFNNNVKITNLAVFKQSRVSAFLRHTRNSASFFKWRARKKGLNDYKALYHQHRNRQGLARTHKTSFTYVL